MGRIAKALVIGGGVGGLSAAIAMSKSGVAVDLVEINETWTVYHVGIVVQGNAIRAMQALGIADQCWVFISAGSGTSITLSDIFFSPPSC